MTWSDFYLVCFLVGFGLSALALLAGSVHLHMPHLHVHHGVHISARGGGGGAADLSWFNFGTIAAFLAWFGGTGYLLEHYYHVWFVLALGVAIVQRPGRRGGGVLVPGQGADGAGGGARSGRLRHGRRARQAEHSHPRRRHRRIDLFAGGHAPRGWRAQRGWRGHPQRRRSDGDALRERASRTCGRGKTSLDELEPKS